METESRLEGAKGWGGGWEENGKVLFNGLGDYLG